MPNSPEIRLVVTLAGGESRTYPLEYGRLVIGSGADCDIRIEDAGVAPAHALLLVELDGITLVNLRDPASVRVGGAPLPGNRKISAHDPVSVAEVAMKLIPVGLTEPFGIRLERDVPIEVEARAYNDLQKGMAGYRLLRDRLFAHIDPREAAAGQREFQRMRWCLIAVIAVLAALRLAAFYSFPTEAVGAAFGRAYMGVELLGLLVLGGVMGLSVAGRVLLTTWALWAVATVASHAARTFQAEGTASYDVAMGILLTAGLLSGFAAGALFDYGISLRPGRSRPEARRWALVGFAASMAAYAIYYEDASPLTAAAIGLCFAWPWWPGPQIDRRMRRATRRDTRVLATAGELRWLRTVGGAALAAILGFFPLFLFFHTFGLREGVRIDDGGHPQSRVIVGAVHQDRRIDPADVVWFWGSRARLLRGSDFHDPGLRVFSHWDRVVAEFSASLRDGTYQPDADAPVLPEGVLQEHANHLDSLLAGRNAPGSVIRFLEPSIHQDLYRALSASTLENGATLVVSDDDFMARWSDAGSPLAVRVPTPAEWASEGRLWVETVDVGTMRRADAQWVARQILVLPPLLVAFGFMGFFFLVRRGGDSATARWMGIWLAGESAAYFFGGLGDYINPARWRLMDLSAAQSAVWDSSANIVDFAEYLARYNSFGPWAVSVPFCFVWVHLCWPTSPWRHETAWRRNLEIAAKAVAVGAALLALRWLVRALAPPDPEVDLHAASNWVRMREVVLWTRPWLLLAVAAGVVARRRLGGAAGEVARLGWTPVVVFVAMLSAPPFLYNGLAGWTGGGFIDGLFRALTVGGAVLAAVAIVGFLLLIRRDFLHVANAATLIWVALVIVVPAAVGLIEALLLATFAGTPLLSEAAATAFGVFVVALLLPRIHRWLQKGTELLLVPRLPRIERAIDHSLEAAVEAEDPGDRRGEIAHALEGLGIEHYAIYKRRNGIEGEGVVSFDRYLVCIDDRELPEALPVSDNLRGFLARRRTFVDFLATPYEWSLFFQQFELHRIERAVGFRYLLPICLGSSVRGLLLLGDGDVERQISQDPVAGKLGTLGLETVSG